MTTHQERYPSWALLKPIHSWAHLVLGEESPLTQPPLLCENNTYGKVVVEMIFGGRGL